MYRIVNGSTRDLPDVAAFVDRLATLAQLPTAEARELFNGQVDLFVTRAPGRLDVMGGIADYSGSLVLQLPIREAALVALQRDDARVLSMVSLAAKGNGRTLSFRMPISDLERDGEPITYEDAHAFFLRDKAHRWAAYVAGAFLVLMRERGILFKQGARLLIDSQVPEGKGVSSSAAIEVAVMSAIAAAFDVSLSPRDMALLCQKVENLIVGAPCGVMDQMTAVCGQKNQLLALLCQPAELQTPRSLPEGVLVWGIDSGIRHSVGGGDYGSVRTGAFMGYRMIAEVAKLRLDEAATPGVLKFHDSKWNGYLANIGPTEFDRDYQAYLPERMSGAEFLSRYHGITDSVTRVEPARSYAVLAPTKHPIFEHARVRRFAELLIESVGERNLTSLGGFMYESHASYSACGLNSEGTDLLVELVRKTGNAQGLYGAKITGGGSGGTVAVLGDHASQKAIEQIAEEYERQRDYRPFIFSGSSPGAATFGHLRLSPLQAG